MPGPGRRRSHQFSLPSFLNGTNKIVATPPKKSPEHPILHAVKRTAAEREAAEFAAEGIDADKCLSPGKKARGDRRNSNVYDSEGKGGLHGFLQTPPRGLPEKGSEHSPRVVNKRGSQYSILVDLTHRGRTLRYLGKVKREQHYDSPSPESDWRQIAAHNKADVEDSLTTIATQTDSVDITLDLIESIKGRQENRQEAVMGDVEAVHYLLKRGFYFETAGGEILNTKKELTEHKIELVWAHIVADRIGGKNKVKNLMVGSNACNLAERMITDGLIKAMKNYKKTNGKARTGRWELTIITHKAKVTGRPGPIQEYWANIASKQIYSYVYVDPAGISHEPLEFTLDLLDPNPLSFAHMGVNLRTLFADVMRNKPLFESAQFMLTTSHDQPDGERLLTGFGRTLFSSGASSSAEDDSSTGTDDPEAADFAQLTRFATGAE